MELSPHDYQGPFGTRWTNRFERNVIFNLFHSGFQQFAAPLPIIHFAIDQAFAQLANEKTKPDVRDLIKQFLIIVNTTPNEIEDYVNFVLQRRTLPAEERKRIRDEQWAFWGKKRKAAKTADIPLSEPTIDSSKGGLSHG